MLQLLRQLIHQLNLLVGASVDALVGTRVGAIFDANNVTSVGSSVGASFYTCVGKRGDASLRTSFHIYLPISWCIILYISWHIGF